MTPPLISIALCTYNGGKYLRQQLETLVDQDYPNLEIVVVDDLSSDNTWMILEEHAAKYKNIRLFKNEKNLGYTKNFEKAITLCKGQYIALADQDDIWTLNKISILQAAMQDNVLVYHDSYFIDENGKRIGNSSISTIYNVYEGESTLPFILSNWISGHAAMFDRKLIEFIIPFDKRFYHDWWIAFAALSTGKIKYVDQLLVGYRQHGHSITDSLNTRAPQNKAPEKGLRRISLNLEWLKYMADSSFGKDKEVLKYAYHVLSGIPQKKRRLQAFNFLIKNYDLLFYVTSKPKSFISKLNKIRKVCFD